MYQLNFFQKKKIKNPSGFTLIEILLVTALIAMVSVAVFKAFSGGVKIWERMQKFSSQEDIMIFLDKLTVDLSNTFYYSKIKFFGSETKVVFATFVRTSLKKTLDGVSGPQEEQIGAVEYSLDYETRQIERAQANYSQALKDQFFDRRSLVSGAEGLRFVYYYPDGQEIKPYFQAKESIPSAILVEVTYIDEGQKKTISRFIPVHVGL